MRVLSRPPLPQQGGRDTHIGGRRDLDVLGIAFDPNDCEVAESFDHLGGVVVAVRKAAAVMGEGGRIISVGSCLGERVPFRGLADYSATKAAIVRHFLLENWLIVTTGAVLGLALAYALNYGLVTWIQGTKLDLGMLAAGVAALWMLGILSALGPALRAAAVPPAIATRNV